MAYCLPKFAGDALKEKLVSGELSPEKLGKMTPEERHNAFAFLGEEHASKVNGLFESKLLLKNQQAGMITWAKQVLGPKHPVYRDMLAKVEKLDKVLDKAGIDDYLSDLVSYKLGIKVSEGEVKTLIEMSKEIERTKANLPKEMFDRPQHEYLKQETAAQMEKRLEYGASYVRFKRYSESLSPRSKGITLSDFVTKPVSTIGSVAKSIKASLDNSFWLNQGIPALFNPRLAPIWAKNFAKSFGDIQKGLRKIDATEAVQAEIYSRPDAVNGTYAREKADLGLRTEEAYPTSLPERIPVLGRVFGASSNAYNAGALRMRADILDYHNRLARIQGVDITNKVTAEAIGHIANSTSGRGSLGVGEPSLQWWNNVMFSPRLVKGAFDTLTAHLFDPKVRANLLTKEGRNSPQAFAQKQAAKQLLSMAATYHAVMLLYEAMNPGSTDLDPRSAHWGQVKIGDNQWMNIVGPFRPLVRTISSGIIPTFHEGELGWWRKTSTGKWRGIPVFPKKAPEYGAYTALDVVETFFEGKASPLFSLIRDHLKGTDFTGEPPTPVDDIRKLTVPISIDTYIEDSGSKSTEEQDNALRNAIINAFGAGVTTY